MIYYNKHIQTNTLDEAWEYWYDLLNTNSEATDSRDGSVIGEAINAITIINDPTKCIMHSEIRKLPMRYCIGELLWYISGNNNLKEIQKYTHNWDRMSDNGKTVNSNYGYCIQNKYGFNQWDYVKKLLQNNPETRQAVIHIKTASQYESKDVNCTVCLQFFIRDNKLYLTSYMRSNDIWLGFPYDVFQFTAMQIIMSMQLGIELGAYTHIAGSLHLYERNKRENIN